MDAFSNVPPHQKAELMQHIEGEQLKESLRMYNTLVESCFDRCVMVGWGGNFQAKTLDETEVKCVTQCAEKYLKTTQRIGLRFAETQAAKAQSS